MVVLNFAFTMYVLIVFLTQTLLSRLAVEGAAHDSLPIYGALVCVQSCFLKLFSPNNRQLSEIKFAKLEWLLA